MEEDKSSKSFSFLPNHLSVFVIAAVAEVAEPGNDSSQWSPGRVKRITA